MKRVVLVLLLVFSSFSAYAETDPFKVQTISGYIDDITYLYVSPFNFGTTVSNGYAGINLDYSDTSNDNPFKNQVNLIKPISGNVLGLQIGSFTVLTTYKSTAIAAINLVITHTKLLHTTDTSAKLDYELGVLYSVSNGIVDPQNPPAEVREVCLSTETSPDNKIVISLLQGTKIAAIQNGYIYFRLKDTATVTGQYESVVTFSLEAL